MSQEETLPHERTAQEAERVGDELGNRADQLGDRIDDARADWKAKKADAGVPGAPPDPDDDIVDSDAPEADYPTKGSSEEAVADGDEHRKEAEARSGGDDSAGTARDEAE